MAAYQLDLTLSNQLDQIKSNQLDQGIPRAHGTKMGPWLFILMINNPKLSGFSYWKYIDDTTNII
jgi:hypothetical protein